VAIGYQAGQTNQGSGGIAIGNSASIQGQGVNAIAIGNNSALTNQGQHSIMIGIGGQTQGSFAVCVGSTGSSYQQGQYSIALGNGGSNVQQTYAVAIGQDAGLTGQGSYAIAIGYQAGYSQQNSNSIAINGTSNPLNVYSQGFFVNPIRTQIYGITGFSGFTGLSGITGTTAFIGITGASNLMTYNTQTNEIQNMNNLFLDGYSEFTNNGNMTLGGSLTFADNSAQLSTAYPLDYSKFSQYWSLLSNTPTNGIGSAMSATGQYQYISCSTGVSGGTIFYSSNYGNSWTSVILPNVSIVLVYQIATSTSGQYCITGQSLGNLFISNNFGQNWIIANANSDSYTGCAISGTGKYMTATSSTGKVYVSNNYGQSWTTLSIGNVNWTMSMSVSGQFQSFPVNSTISSAIYYSSDYGQTFIQSTGSASNFGAYNITVSSSGQYQICTGNNNRGILYSINYGKSWVQSSLTTGSWIMCSMTSSGQYQVITGGLSNTYYSTNYGVFWTVATSALISVTMSSNGQFITATQTSGAYMSITPQGNLYASLTGSNTTINPILHNAITKSIGYNTGKTFVIDHPLNKNKYLIHACLEGPEVGVYYRGKGIIENNLFAIIKLPDYVDKLAKNLTIQITPIYSKNASINKLTTTSVENGEFLVYGKNGEFYWKVMGERLSLQTEVIKENTEIMGDGPYTYFL